MEANENVLLSVKECCELFREYGIKIGNEFLCDGIRQGKFPFAFAIQGNEWRYYISRAKTIAWLEDFTGIHKQAS